MSILIKNGRVITAEQDYFADIFVEKDKITTLGANLTLQADKVIDAKGKYVIPGGIDVHTRASSISPFNRRGQKCARRLTSGG